MHAEEALTLSNCLHANSSSEFTGSRSMTGLDIVLTDDSTISAPYYTHRRPIRSMPVCIPTHDRRRRRIRTLTTRELALPCSYARRAVLKSGRWATRETKSGESTSTPMAAAAAMSSGARVGDARVGDVDEDAMLSAGVGWNAVGEGFGQRSAGIEGVGVVRGADVRAWGTHSWAVGRRRRWVRRCACRRGRGRRCGRSRPRRRCCAGRCGPWLGERWSSSSTMNGKRGAWAALRWGLVTFTCKSK